MQKGDDRGRRPGRAGVALFLRRENLVLREVLNEEPNLKDAGGGLNKRAGRRYAGSSGKLGAA